MAAAVSAISGLLGDNKVRDRVPPAGITRRPVRPNPFAIDRAHHFGDVRKLCLHFVEIVNVYVVLVHRLGDHVFDFLVGVGPRPYSDADPKDEHAVLNEIGRGRVRRVGLFSSPSVMSRTSFVESARAPPMPT